MFQGTRSSRAVEAVKSGDSFSSAVMLKSIKQDGLLLQKQASILCDELKKTEKKHQEIDEGPNWADKQVTCRRGGP